MLYFGIPCIQRSLISGKWRCWDPGVRGICLDICIVSSGSSTIGAGLFRAHQGSFQLAVTDHVQHSKSLSDLIEFMDYALGIAKKYNINVAIVQCSHNEMFHVNASGISSAPWRLLPNIRGILDQYGVCIMRRIPMILNQAATALAYNCVQPLVTRTLAELPKLVIRSVHHDYSQIRVFCPPCSKGDSNTCSSKYYKSATNIQDDLFLHSNSNAPRAMFRDDMDL